MPQDRTPLGDAMTHRFPEQKVPTPRGEAQPDVPAPESIPPTGNPEDIRDGDGKPKAPPANDEPGRRYIPMDLPGREHAPERV